MRTSFSDVNIKSEDNQNEADVVICINDDDDEDSQSKTSTGLNYSAGNLSSPSGSANETNTNGLTKDATTKNVPSAALTATIELLANNEPSTSPTDVLPSTIVNTPSSSEELPSTIENDPCFSEELTSTSVLLPSIIKTEPTTTRVQSSATSRNNANIAKDRVAAKRLHSTTDKEDANTSKKSKTTDTNSDKLWKIFETPRKRSNANSAGSAISKSSTNSIRSTNKCTICKKKMRSSLEKEYHNVYHRLKRCCVCKLSIDDRSMKRHFYSCLLFSGKLSRAEMMSYMTPCAVSLKKGKNRDIICKSRTERATSSEQSKCARASSSSDFEDAVIKPVKLSKPSQDDGTPKSENTSNSQRPKTPTKTKKPFHKKAIRKSGSSQKKSNDVLHSLKDNNSIPIWWDHEATKDRLFSVNDCPITHVNYIDLSVNDKLTPNTDNRDAKITVICSKILKYRGGESSIKSPSVTPTPPTEPKTQTLPPQNQNENRSQVPPLSKLPSIPSQSTSPPSKLPSIPPLKPLSISPSSNHPSKLKHELEKSRSHPQKPSQQNQPNGSSKVPSSPIRTPPTVVGKEMVRINHIHIGNETPSTANTSEKGLATGNVSSYGKQSTSRPRSRTTNRLQSVSIAESLTPQTNPGYINKVRRYSVSYSDNKSRPGPYPTITVPSSISPHIVPPPPPMYTSVNQYTRQDVSAISQPNIVPSVQNQRPNSAFTTVTPSSFGPLETATSAFTSNNNFKILSPNEVNLRAERLAAEGSARTDGNQPIRRMSVNMPMQMQMHDTATSNSNTGPNYNRTHATSTSSPMGYTSNGNGIPTSAFHMTNSQTGGGLKTTPNTNTVCEAAQNQSTRQSIEVSLVRLTGGRLELIFLNNAVRMDFNQMSETQRIEVQQSLMTNNIWYEMLNHIKMGEPTQETLVLFKKLLPQRELKVFFETYNMARQTRNITPY